VSRPWVIDIETVPLGTVSGGLTGVPSHWMDAVPYQPPEPRKVPASYRDPAKIAAKQRELELRYQHELAADQAEHAAKRVAEWKARALSPYTAEVIALAMHPVQADPLEEHGDVEVLAWQSETVDEAQLLRGLEAALVRHQVTHLVSWGSYDPPVLREAMCRHDLHLPALENLTRQSVRGRAWYTKCLDASVLTHARHANHSRGWGLKHIARQLGWADPASVQSASVYDAWLAGDYHGCAERAAVDVWLVLRILERERALHDVLDWARGN